MSNYLLDIKGEFTPVVINQAKKWGKKNRKKIPVFHINTSDPRGNTWHIAKDLDGRPDRILNFLNGIMPDPQQGEKMWSQAARAILLAIILCLYDTFGEEFGFYEIWQYCFAEISTLIDFFQKDNIGKSISTRFLESSADKTRDGVLYNLSSSVIDNLFLFAVDDYHTPKSKRLAIKDFLRSESILLLGVDPSSRKATSKVYNAFLSIYIDLLNSLEDNVNLPAEEQRKCFQILDEVAYLGQIRNLESLLSFAASKGSITYLAFQNIDQLHKNYGKDTANSILGNCLYRQFFEPGSITSRDYMINVMGKKRKIKPRFSQSFNAQSGYGFNVTYDEVLEDLVNSDDLRESLGEANYESGMRFYACTPLENKKVFYTRYERHEVEQLKHERAANIKSFIPKPAHHNTIPNISPEQWEVFLNKTFTSEQIFNRFMEGQENRSDFEKVLSRRSDSKRTKNNAGRIIRII